MIQFQVYKILNQIDSIPANKFFTVSEASQTRGHIKYKLVEGHNRTRLAKDWSI